MCVQVRPWFLCNAVCLRESRIHQRIFGTLIVLNLAQIKPNPAALPAGWQHSWRVPAYGLLPSQRKLSLAARMAPSASASLVPAGTPRACLIAGLPAAAKETVQQDRCRHSSTGPGTDVRHSCTHPRRRHTWPQEGVALKLVCKQAGHRGLPCRPLGRHVCRHALQVCTGRYADK